MRWLRVDERAAIWFRVAENWRDKLPYIGFKLVVPSSPTVAIMLAILYNTGIVLLYRADTVDSRSYLPQMSDQTQQLQQ